jgi:hypothetical protein
MEYPAIAVFLILTLTFTRAAFVQLCPSWSNRWQLGALGLPFGDIVLFLSVAQQKAANVKDYEQCRLCYCMRSFHCLVYEIEQSAENCTCYEQKSCLFPISHCFPPLPSLY